MNSWSLLLLLFGLTAQTVRAEDPQDPEREARLEFVRDKFSEWALSRGNADSNTAHAPFKNQLNPVLRYTNPIGGLVRDGTLFFWRDGVRPVAACSFSIRGPEDPQTVYFEMTSLAGTPLRCERAGQVRWMPKSGSLIDQPLPDAAAPEDRPVARLTTMRNIARRFEAENYRQDGKASALRLMPQPIDRFQDEPAGVLDAGLFAFVEANDPELLLLVEARKNSNGEKSWRYTVARMTSRELRVRLDGKEVFTAPNFWQGAKSPEEPYIEARDGQMVLTQERAADTAAPKPVPSNSTTP